MANATLARGRHFHRVHPRIEAQQPKPTWLGALMVLRLEAVGARGVQEFRPGFEGGST